MYKILLLLPTLAFSLPLISNDLGDMKEFNAVLFNVFGYFHIFFSGYYIDNYKILHLIPSSFYFISLLFIPIIVFLLFSRLKKDTRIIISLLSLLFLLISSMGLFSKNDIVQIEFNKKLKEKYHIDKKHQVYYFIKD